MAARKSPPVQGTSSALHILDLLQKCNRNSSRSHAVLQIAVRIRSKDGGALKIGKLNMIDLAGSDR